MQVVRDTDVGIWRDDFVWTLRAIKGSADGIERFPAAVCDP
jgi:trehalose 6-phosphate synthase